MLFVRLPKFSTHQNLALKCVARWTRSPYLGTAVGGQSVKLDRCRIARQRDRTHPKSELTIDRAFLKSERSIAPIVPATMDLTTIEDSPQ